MMEYLNKGGLLAVTDSDNAMTCQGYFGGMLDAATGLIYLGNGQYWDPETGRFLTR